MKTCILALGFVLVSASVALAQSTVMNSGLGDFRPSTSAGSSDRPATSRLSVSKQFAQIDLSHNGLVTRGEWGAAGLNGPDFGKLDTNHDSRVDLQEWEAAMGGRPKPGAGTKPAAVK